MPRLVDGGASERRQVGDGGNDGCASVTLTLAAPAGKRVVVAKQLYVGWTKAVAVDHLRLHFDKLLVRRAMDPSCPPDKPTCPCAASRRFPARS